jgi:O-antigen ligase
MRDKTAECGTLDAFAQPAFRIPYAASQSADTGDVIEPAGFVTLLGFVTALQFSIAVAQILLTLTLLCWVLVLLRRREAVELPPVFWPLVFYAAITLVSATSSRDPRVSFVDSKQLLLFIIVPLVYRLASADRAATVVQAIISAGAASAAFGIVQYGILQYDNLGRRPQGALGHYMTYSGLLMLVICAAAARVVFQRRDRTWAALVMPALLVALVLTFTRSAWVGACAGVALLFALKDFRLMPVLALLAALFFAFAPPRVTDRFYSMFNLKDPTSVDRVAMLYEGAAMIRAHPLTGVGPNMVQRVYAEYRDPRTVVKINPHLHNVPVQIAAERGLPALAIWIWFIVALVIDLSRRVRRGQQRSLSAAALAAVVGMLAAGMFEYNFGDSEFLMLFLVLVTLPYAAERVSPAPSRAA